MSRHRNGLYKYVARSVETSQSKPSNWTTFGQTFQFNALLNLNFESLHGYLASTTNDTLATSVLASTRNVGTTQQKHRFLGHHAASFFASSVTLTLKASDFFRAESLNH